MFDSNRLPYVGGDEGQVGMFRMNVLVLVVVAAVVLASCADGVGTFISEPLPELEQLDEAADCATLNSLMTGVMAESFRSTAEITLDQMMAGDESQRSEGFESLDPYYQAGESASARLNCSPSERDASFENALLAGCDEWLSDGHGADEEPLLFNTAMCLDPIANR